MRRWVHRFAHDTVGRTRHTAGTAPLEGRRLPPARILIVEENADGVYVTRYASSGEFAGDTWHATSEDAFHQAQFEYGVVHDDWAEVSTDHRDPLSNLGGARRGSGLEDL
jgi:hypothetical protein